ncbi:MAG: MarR family winged helix-turn-helix transcriptional regulator [Candidatus Limnocylindrales bacterium]
MQQPIDVEDVAGRSPALAASTRSDRPQSVFATSFDPVERRAWRAFLQTHARVARRLEADLIARNDLPLAEFDVLFQLASAEGSRLRMNELADRVLLSRAGITRLVDRLVVDGLVGRVRCESDARGFYAVLTTEGTARLQEAIPGHVESVRSYFLERFNRSELEQLAGLLERASPAE